VHLYSHDYGLLAAKVGLLYFWQVRLHTTPRETVKTHLTLPKLKIISHSLRLKKLKIISGKTKNP
jgi:hypothetical protein